MRTRFPWAIALAAAPLAMLGPTLANIRFEEVPTGTTLVGTDDITLSGDSEVVGDLAITGITDVSASGIRFADGTVQTTAFIPGAGSANLGLYDNRIADFSPPNAYTEVCVKGGAVSSDIHTMGEPTVGGNCVPGDVGWVIERDERSSLLWADAKMACLLDGMRLPEPFEFSYSCRNDTVLGLNDMQNQFHEWASNTAAVSTIPDDQNQHGAAVASIGFGDCGGGRREFMAAGNGGLLEGNLAFRCVR